MRNVASGRALAHPTPGVAGNDRAFKRQLLKERERRRDLVLVGCNGKIADHRGQLRGDSRDHVQRLGVKSAAAPQGLAVDGDMARCVAPACKAAERSRQGVAVERAEDIMVGGVMVGGVAGRPLNAEQRQRLAAPLGHDISATDRPFAASTCAAKLGRTNGEG